MPSLKIEITRNLTEVVDINEPMTLGRGKENDIILLDGIVSRHHARVYQEESEILIEDLNSANGMFVNSNRVFLRALQDNDVIRVGNTKIYYSTEIWDSPPKTIDLINNSFEDFDLSDLVNSRDILFRFGSDDESINQIYEITRQKFELVEVSEMERINLDAALNEGIGNAQRHGHKYDTEKVIEFRYIHKPDKLVMRVTDQGDGFDYRAELRRKKEGNAVDEARNRYKQGGYGGLGIMLMLKCVHKVEYNRKGNQVTLTKFLGDEVLKFEEEQRLAAQEDMKNQEEQDNPDIPSPVSTDLEMQGGMEISADDGLDISGGMEISADDGAQDELSMAGGMEISADDDDNRNKGDEDDLGSFVIEPD